MRESLRNRFALLFALCFALGGAAAYLWFDWYDARATAGLGQRLVERNALYHKGQVLSALAPEISLARKMSSSPLLRAWVAAEASATLRTRARDELDDYRKFFRSRSYFFAIAQSGNYYFDDGTTKFATAPQYTLDPKLIKDGWFYSTLRNPLDVQLNVDTDRHLQLTRLWINAVVRDEQGTGVAVTGTGVDLTEIIQKVIASRSHETANLLMDQSGAIQAHPDLGMIDYASARKGDTNEARKTLFEHLSSEDIEPLRTAMRQLTTGNTDVFSLALTLDGRPQLVGITWIPEIRWFLASIADPSIAASQSQWALGAVGLALALTLVAAGGMLTFDQVVTHRLRRLDSAVKQLAEGRFDVHIEDKGADEIGRLGRAFATMAHRVDGYTADLRQQVEERTRSLEAAAITDYLTSALNRRGMELRFAAEANRMRREAHGLGVLVIDLDHFKRINDSHGHAAGDTVLVLAANTLRANLRDYDLLARWGGEEFIVALPDVAGFDDLVATAEKLRLAIAEAPAALAVAGKSQTITCSIGATLARADESLEEIFARADHACYAAKAQGRNKTVFVPG